MSSSDIEQTMKYSAFVALLCVFLVGSGYYYYQYTEEKNRGEVLLEVADIEQSWKDIESKYQQIIGVTARKVNFSAAELQAMLEINEESAALRIKFLALENTNRRKTHGVLPQWLKDDRSWQQLNRIYGVQGAREG